MTDAYVPVKNETNCNQVSAKIVNNNSTGNNTDHPATLEQDNKCNITNNFNPTQEIKMLTLNVKANETSKDNENDHKNATQDCREDLKNISDECLQKIAKINEIPKKDTILKYVYKKNDGKSIINIKSPGHPLNSLRKKRSTGINNSVENMKTRVKSSTPVIENFEKESIPEEVGKKPEGLNSKTENITSDASENLPLIVNYETAHTPQGREIEVALPIYQRQTENTIQNSALADFNIETLHEPLKKENQNENSSSRSEEDSRESGEKKDYDRDENRSSSDESSEEQDYPKSKESRNSDYTKTQTPHRNSGESNENGDYKQTSSSNEDSRELNDDDRDIDYKKSKTPYRKSDKNIGREDYKENSSSNEDSRDVSDNGRDNSERLRDSYDKYEHHPQKQKNNFEQYDDNPRKTEGSFEKYDVNPQKPDGSFEKYEDKEYPQTNKAAYSKPEHSHKNLEGNEKYSDTSRSAENSESQESDEKNDSTEPKNSLYKENSKSGYEKESSEKPNISKSKNQDDSGESNENSSEYNKESQPHKHDLHKNDLNKPLPIQDVDLGDFSYERVQVNDKGQIIPDKENDEVDISKSINSDKGDISQITQIPSSEIDEQLKSEIYESIKQPIRINGEIKPVVEINSEHNDGETSDENSKEAFRSSPENDVSLESILSTDGKENNEQNEKIINKKEQSESGDVKQQFERIPTDYQHENRKEDDSKNTQQTQSDSPNEENAGEVHNDGTLNIFSPKDENYDEHLKFKFDDVSIKLPEIKLPEDILAYAYEEPAYEKKGDHYEDRKNKPKQKFYHYSDENADDSPSKQNKGKKYDDDEQDHQYYGYYEPNEEKQNLRKKQDDEDGDVDLYEKFVRERFGKQGSFEKRSEKLQDASSLPYNPKLYETVQNILKKTAQIDKEAKKSGDPNAGYQWTLEYGENLK